MTELCKLALKYGSDKCPELVHPYTPFYFKLFSPIRYKVKKVFEFGIGSQHTMKHVKNYQTGASLRMWQDFFPNAQIYGADIFNHMMIKDKRIQTFKCNEMDKVAVEAMLKQIGPDIDIFIDDAWHRTNAQSFLCQTAMPLLNKNVFYFIEDVLFNRQLAKTFPQYDSYAPYMKCKIRLPHQKLLMVQHKRTQYEASPNLKSLLIYITPSNKFLTEEAERMARLHIDNFLSLGYRKEDIVYVTNWPFEYNGVKSVVVGVENYYNLRPRSIKTAIIPQLINLGIIEKGKLYWNHDFDAYQNTLFDTIETELEDYDIGLTDFGWKKRYCMGSYFFKDTSLDIFEEVKRIIHMNIEDEEAMIKVNQNKEMEKRSKLLNITYDIGWRNIEANMDRAMQPFKVLHFHPIYKRINVLEKFMYGVNDLHLPLMSSRLKEVFKQHGFR